MMELFGKHDPTGGDGYVPGAWDEVRDAFLDGHISEEAYTILQKQMSLLRGHDEQLQEAPPRPEGQYAEEYHSGALYGIRHPGPREGCPYCADTIAQAERWTGPVV